MFGTVTLLFTDIEGSTRLWQDFPDAMPAALARHHDILHRGIQEHNGQVFQIVGDAFHAAFASALAAIQAAREIQCALANETWGATGPIRVRMALHTDHAQVHEDKYAAGDYGTGEYLFLARTARLLSVGHGGQILVSSVTAELVLPQLPQDVSLRDLGVHRVKDFSREHIFQLTTPELPSEFPPLNTLEFLPNNLPLQLSSFVGREKELREIQKLVQVARLLTLTGTGGAGKTRLSLQVAANVIDQFQHGVWFVELAPLSDPNLVTQVVATTLGLREPAGRTLIDLLKEHLRDKKLLLILDNCEHVIEACAQWADTLLRAASHLKILASSREALGVTGEITYPVPPLSFPKIEMQADIETLTQYESVRLFVERARAVQPSFAVTEANAAALAQICQRLDGIPLALELAAARVRGLTVEQIAARLDDRFRLLTSTSRTVLPRQQTLRAAIDWSYSLLSDTERVLFQQLSVFAGGWSLEAAEQVAAGHRLQREDVLDVLMRLVDKSLVVVEQQASVARYRFLETIREYAQETLLESGEEYVTRVQNRHLDYFLSFVQAVDQMLRGAEQKSALVALDRELDNLRAALAWSSKSNNVEAELRLATGLWRYWRVRSYFSEGRNWLEDALAKSEQAAPSARAKALLGAGSLANYQADYARAHQLLQKSLALHRALDDKQGIAYCLNLLSHGEMMMGNFAAARAALEESLAIFRELGDTRGVGYSLYFLGSMHLSSDDLAAARPLLEESLRHLKAAGDRWWVGNTLIQLGWGIHRQGEHENAIQMFDEALQISAQFGDTRGTARALLYIAEAKCSQGEFVVAREKYNQALKHFHEIGDKFWGTVCLEGLGLLAVEQNDARRAAVLLGAAEHTHELLGAPMLAAYRPSYESCTARARTQLGEREFNAAWAEGRALTYDEAIQFAMNEELPIDSKSA